MRDVELYRALLGLTAPWTVADVDVDMKGQRVVVRVEAGPGPYPCPECGTPTGRYDSKRRRWRHLDTMQFTTCAHFGHRDHSGRPIVINEIGRS
jgi:transposase